MTTTCATPERAIDAGLPQRIARGGGTVQEAEQVRDLLARLEHYESALRWIAIYGTGEAAMVAARAITGDALHG
jgi:hypothetical protein